MLTPGSERAELILQTERLIELASQPGALEKLTDEQKARLGVALKSAHQHVQAPLLERLFPDDGPRRRELYERHIEHFAAGALYKARAFMAANRVGKTYSGAYETSCHATGWYPPWWTGWRVDEPGEYLVAAKYTKTLKKVPQKTLFGRAYRGPTGRFRLKGDGMVPASAILHDTSIFMPAAPGTLSEIGLRYKDSQVEWSTLTFLSYEMGRGVFEGSEYLMAWLDEECPMEIYVEIMKRLMTTQGRMVLTWTPLDGLTDVVLSFMAKDFKPPEFDEEDMDSLVPLQPRRDDLVAA